jgi:uncharacterized membrane protein YtjA (UPF0391 family)
MQRPATGHGWCTTCECFWKEAVMFSWALAFFIVALVAGFFGFFGIAASAAGIAKIIFIVALIMAIFTFVFGRRRAAKL